MSKRVTLGENLRRMREAKGWGLREAARRLGMHSGNLCNIEKGRRMAGHKTLETMARVYGGEITITYTKRGRRR